MQAAPNSGSLLRWLRGYGPFAGLALLWAISLFGAFWFDNLLAWTAGLLYIAYDTWLIGYVAWQTRALPREAAQALRQPVQQPVTLGVIVPARNEASVIAATVDALLAQRDAADAILLVDDGSTDATRAVLARRYALPERGHGHHVSTSHPRLALLAKPNSGKADSLNHAWPLLTTDVVVTLDADTRLEPDALGALRHAFAREPQLVACCGVLTPRCGPGPLARLFEAFQRYEYLRAFLSRAAWMKAGALLLVSGAFAGYRRAALAQVGGYDRDSLVEDYELIHRLHRHAHECGLDWRVRVIGEARASTDAPETPRSFLQQRRRWFAGFLQTQYAYRAMHGDPRYGAVGRLMLPVKAVDTLQPVYGITALLLLILFLARGGVLAAEVLAVIALKLVIDFAYHLWALRLYHRWLGRRAGARLWAGAVLVTLAEPFSFQILRHGGALWGWRALLNRRRDWMPQRRISITGDTP